MRAENPCVPSVTANPHPISFSASAARLAEGARFNDEIHRLPSGSDSFIPKGVYHFKAHAEANQHQSDCLAKGMASVARARHKSAA
ncbi:MAG: hypothetical protein NTV11_04155 [Rhodocyclales bacterium]|nr:hypothetical protein [Rhodocyclales bacterium]